MAPNGRWGNYPWKANTASNYRRYLQKKNGPSKPIWQHLADLRVGGSTRRYERNLVSAIRLVILALSKRDRALARQQKKDAKRRSRLERVFVEPVSRGYLWRRDGSDCYLCGKPLEIKTATIDHVRPLAKGGTHERANCRLAHSLCNSRKRDLGPLVAMAEIRSGI